MFKHVAIADALGTVLARHMLVGDVTFPEGHTIAAVDIEFWRANGITTAPTVVRVSGDISDNEAAARVGALFSNDSLQLAGPVTGRVNLVAAHSGLLEVHEVKIADFNMLDPALSLVTLRQHARVDVGGRVATLKCTPLFVPRELLLNAQAFGQLSDCVVIRRYARLRLGLVQVRDSFESAIVARRISEQLAVFMSGINGKLGRTFVCKPIADDLRIAVKAVRSQQLSALVVVSELPVLDPDDPIVRTLVEAGARIERLAVPADPGNLTCIGWLKSARLLIVSSAGAIPQNHCVWRLLEASAAGVSVTDETLARAAVGGLHV